VPCSALMAETGAHHVVHVGRVRTWYAMRERCMRCGWYLPHCRQIIADKEVLELAIVAANDLKASAEERTAKLEDERAVLIGIKKTQACACARRRPHDRPTKRTNKHTHEVSPSEHE